MDRDAQAQLRRYLLGTASGAALVGAAPLAHADGTIDHIYIDGAFQYAMYGGQSTAWAPSFFNFDEPRIGARNGWNTFDDVVLQSGDWYLTIAADYGRSGSAHAALHQTHYSFPKYYTRTGKARSHEEHTVLDFTVGKDVGLGMFGLDGSSIISGGLRYAHFISHTATHFSYYYSKFNGPTSYSSFARLVDRQFVGVGPIITWKARTPIAPDFSFSWGASAAAVIGSRSFELNGDKVRGQGNVVSPQIGGNVGITWQEPGSPFALTAGYRVNAYFKIYDQGFDFGGKHTDRIIHGPFAQATWQVE